MTLDTPCGRRAQISGGNTQCRSLNTRMLPHDVRRDSPDRRIRQALGAIASARPPPSERTASYCSRVRCNPKRKATDLKASSPLNSWTMVLIALVASLPACGLLDTADRGDTTTTEKALLASDDETFCDIARDLRPLGDEYTYRDLLTSEDRSLLIPIVAVWLMLRVRPELLEEAGRYAPALEGIARRGAQAARDLEASEEGDPIPTVEMSAEDLASARAADNLLSSSACDE